MGYDILPYKATALTVTEKLEVLLYINIQMDQAITGDVSLLIERVAYWLTSPDRLCAHRRNH